MIEKWNYFVYDLCEAKKKDVDEDSFHTLIETQLQHLGWAKFKGEIGMGKVQGRDMSQAQHSYWQQQPHRTRYLDKEGWRGRICD